VSEENIKANEVEEDIQDIKADCEDNTSEENTEAANADNTEEVSEEGAETEEAAETEENAEDKSEEQESSKKHFKKKDKKDAKDTKIEELTDQVKRQLAEFENFRNRTEKEKSSMYEMGAKSVIEKILPVIDNFERGLATVAEGENTAFHDGMQLVYKQLITELDNIGVKHIEAVGQPFDPNMHNAVMQVASDEYESGTVVQELQKGYTYRDSVVRYSMVSVAE